MQRHAAEYVTDNRPWLLAEGVCRAIDGALRRRIAGQEDVRSMRCEQLSLCFRIAICCASVSSSEVSQHRQMGSRTIRKNEYFSSRTVHGDI